MVKSLKIADYNEFNGSPTAGKGRAFGLIVASNGLISDLINEGGFRGCRPRGFRRPPELYSSFSGAFSGRVT